MTDNNQEIIDTVETQEYENTVEEQAPKMFTQDELDAIVKGRVREERKKAKETEEKIDALTKELEALRSQNAIKDIRDSVSKETGVPASLLTGTDAEACKKQAEAILEFAKPKVYPQAKRNNNNTDANEQANEAMREFARQIFS